MNMMNEIPSDMINKSEKLRIQKGITILSDNNFLLRLWFCISNPFRYVFKGKLRY